VVRTKDGNFQLLAKKSPKIISIASPFSAHHQTTIIIMLTLMSVALLGVASAAVHGDVDGEAAVAMLMKSSPHAVSIQVINNIS
jgi:hypothetical protein